MLKREEDALTKECERLEQEKLRHLRYNLLFRAKHATHGLGHFGSDGVVGWQAGAAHAGRGGSPLPVRHGAQRALPHAAAAGQGRLQRGVPGELAISKPMHATRSTNHQVLKLGCSQAFDVEGLREAAVKVHQLSPGWSEARKANYVRHATREFRIHKALAHPHIVALLDIFELDAGSFATVLECCPGGDLEARLREHQVLSLGKNLETAAPLTSARKCTEGVMHSRCCLSERRR